MNLHRAPQALLTPGVLVGLWLGQLVTQPVLGMFSGMVGIALILASAATRLPAVRRRWPDVTPTRSRLARLWEDTTEIRSELKAEYKASPTTVDMASWEPRLRDFVGDFWDRLAAIEPDDWRREKLEITDFESENLNGGREPMRWAARMLAMLETLRTLVAKRQDSHPLE